MTFNVHSLPKPRRKSERQRLAGLWSRARGKPYSQIGGFVTAPEFKVQQIYRNSNGLAVVVIVRFQGGQTNRPSELSSHLLVEIVQLQSDRKNAEAKGAEKRRRKKPEAKSPSSDGFRWINSLRCSAFSGALG